MKRAIFLIYICISAVGCQPEQGDRKAMMQEEVNRRLAEFEKNRTKKCREELIKSATQQVDSLLIERARINKNDFDKPLIPEKPDVPEILSPLDSSPVQPILEKTEGD